MTRIVDTVQTFSIPKEAQQATAATQVPDSDLYTKSRRSHLESAAKNFGKAAGALADVACAVTREKFKHLRSKAESLRASLDDSSKFLAEQADLAADRLRYQAEEIRQEVKVDGAKINSEKFQAEEI